MILLLDVGNTRLKWAWLQEGILTGSGAVTHSGGLAALADALAACPKPERIAAACVAGDQMANALRAWALAAWGLDIEFVRASAAAAGVSNGYADPARLGVDRWVAAVGAYCQTGRAVCVIDCGSAITFDAVDADARHRGGLIIPGLRLMRRALNQGTADLPLVDDQPVALFANNTLAAISSGTVLAAAAAVDTVAGRMAAECGADTELWLTGGDAPTLLPYLSGRFRHDPDLVLRGIATVASGSPAVSHPRQID